MELFILTGFAVLVGIGFHKFIFGRCDCDEQNVSGGGSTGKHTPNRPADK